MTDNSSIISFQIPGNLLGQCNSSDISYLATSSLKLTDEGMLIAEPPLNDTLQPRAVHITSLTHVCGFRDPRIIEHNGTYYLIFGNFDGLSSLISMANSLNPFNPNSWNQSSNQLIAIHNDRNAKHGGILFADDENGLSQSYLFWGDNGSPSEGIKIAVSNSPNNFDVWTDSKKVLLTTSDDGFDYLSVESGTSPILLNSKDYLFLYNGANKIDDILHHSVGFVILDGNDPKKVIQRSIEPILMPELEWETTAIIQGIIPHPFGCEYANISDILGKEYENNAECFLAVYTGSETTIGGVQILVGYTLEPQKTTLKMTFPTIPSKKATTTHAPTTTITKSSETNSTTTTVLQLNMTTESAATHKEKSIMLEIIIPLMIVIVIIGICIYFFRKRRIQRNKKAAIFDSKPSNQNQTKEEINDEWETTWDKLIIKKTQLGTGAYGEVVLGKILEVEKSFNGMLVEKKSTKIAIKKPRKYANDNAKKNFLKEVEVMKQITGHERVIQMFGCITKGEKLCLILEFCPFLDLHHYIKINRTEKKHQITQNEFIKFGKQISQGMQFLASECIIHRDLAARNILINKNKDVKISDFGLCLLLSDPTQIFFANADLNTGKLPIKMLPPEALENYEFSLKTDVWSFGMLLFEMYSLGETPFSDIPPSELLIHLKAEKRPQKPENCPDEIYSIMTNCWSQIPSNRPTFDELVTIFTVLSNDA